MGQSVHQLARVATGDTRWVASRSISGDRVARWFASANRDDAVFEHPSLSTSERSPNHTSAFSKGNTSAPVRTWRRLELRLMLEALLPQSQVELASKVDGFARLSRGIKHMPVRFGDREVPA